LTVWCSSVILLLQEVDLSGRIQLLIDHVGELLTMGAAKGPRSGVSVEDLGLVKGAALAVVDGRIFRAGPREAVLRDIEGMDVAVALDAEGMLVTPGLIDSHTHSVFAGRRESEFEEKLKGASYREIAEAGGGILETVRQVRKASLQELVELTLPRLDVMLAHGTTTAEVKSGYGLTTTDELKMLEAVRALDRIHPVSLIPTFLGAHEFPPEFRDRKEQYIDLLIEEMLPAVVERDLARFCDVFCETGWFDREQSRRILTVARALGLRIRLHADEFSPSGAAELAAELGAMSADHLVAVSEEGLRMMRASAVIATLLPGTVFFLGLPQRPPVGRMRELGIPIALASDFNPGSSMTQNLQLVQSMAAVLFRMTPAECLNACTVNAAFSLGVADSAGSIEPGKRADLAIFDVDDYRTISYHFGVNHCHTAVKDGKIVYAHGRVSY
jgi:imidazolonepropionase